MADTSNGDPSKATRWTQSASDWSRVVLGVLIPVASIAAIALLGYIIVLHSDDNDDRKWVLSTVLPVLGTWVGTIIAFYFSKENFEAATRSVQSVVTQLTGKELLKSIAASKVMIEIGKMWYLTDSVTDPVDAKGLSQTLADLEAQKKGDRIPVLDSNKLPKYIIHRSQIDKYIAWKVSQPVPAGGPAVVPTALTFNNLFTDKPDLKTMFQTSFATVGESATLADVQAAMERTRDCEDVFITKQSGEVIGWITDNIIQDNLKTQ